MAKIFTTHDVLRYVYNEMQADEKSTFEMVLEKKKDLRDEFNKITDIFQELNKFNLSVSKSTLQRILDEVSNSMQTLQ